MASPQRGRPSPNADRPPRGKCRSRAPPPDHRHERDQRRGRVFRYADERIAQLTRGKTELPRRVGAGTGRDRPECGSPLRATGVCSGHMTETPQLMGRTPRHVPWDLHNLCGVSNFSAETSRPESCRAVRLRLRVPTSSWWAAGSGCAVARLCPGQLHADSGCSGNQRSPADGSCARTPIAEGR